MALHIDGVTQISGSDIRLTESCLRLMKAQNFRVPYTVSSSSEGNKIINQTIAAWEERAENKERFVKSMLDEAKQKLLPIHELDWIKENDRACYWAWLQVRRNNYFAHPLHPTLPVLDPQQTAIALTYGWLNLNAYAASTKERFDEVVKYFDRVGQPLDWQRNLIEVLNSQWSTIFTSRKPLTWLKRADEEQCRWAWEYLIKASIIDSWNRPIVNDINPLGVSELYLAIYAALDAWQSMPDSKRLFLSDFNKAWQQKKHRDSRQGKKVCNLIIREDVKKKLDELSEKRGIKLNQLVEELIERDYERLNT